MNDVSRFILVEEPLGLLSITAKLKARAKDGVPEEAATEDKPQIDFTGPNEDPGLVLTPSEFRAYRFGIDNMVNSITEEASATSYEDDGFGVFSRHEEKRKGMVIRGRFYF